MKREPTNISFATSRKDAPQIQAGAVILLTAGAAIGAGLYIGLFGVSYKEVIVSLIVMAGAVVLAKRERGLRLGMAMFVCCLVLGYRSIHVTADFRIIPAELVLMGLLSWIFGTRIATGRVRTQFWIPRWLWICAPMWLLVWAPWIPVSQTIDIQFAEFLNFILVIPIFAVCGVILVERDAWREQVTLFFGAAVCIAVLGIVEYIFPAAVRSMPGFFANPNPVMSGDGFARAMFSAWGGPHATFICLLALPLGIAIREWYPDTLRRGLIIAGTVALLAAIYIGGYRSIWLGAGIMGTLYAFVGRQFVFAFLSVAAFAIIYPTIPTSTMDRFDSLTLVLEGRPNESSGDERWARATGAWERIQSSPFPHGWGEAGWVHSDVLEIAENQGIPAAVVLLGGYLLVTFRIYRRARQASNVDGFDRLGLPLFLSLVGVGILLTFEGVEVEPQMMLPVWFIWVLAELWLKQTAQPRATNVDAA